MDQKILKELEDIKKQVKALKISIYFQITI